MKFTSFSIVLALVAGASAQCLLSAGDLSTLNYALTLEHLEAAFYANLNTVQALNQTNFAQAGYSASVYAYLQMIGAHEATHVTTLTTVITSSGCNATPACVYQWGQALSSPVNFVSTALALENVGVTAYDGAINTILDGGLRTAAATIATVEARHAAYLATLVSSTPFPSGAFDNPQNSTQVYAAAGAFVNFTAFNCPLPYAGPVVQCNYSGVYNTGFQTPSNLSGCGIYSTGLTTLNYALALEYLEAAFYAQALNNSTNVTGLLAANSTQLAYVQLIAGHEAAHVQFLVNTLSAYGCAANTTAACVYNFTAAFQNASTFYAYAYTFENLGVGAYDGAINTIRDSGFRTAAATIATVEARHAAVIATIIGASASPWPNGAFDPAYNSTFVLANAGTFISSCPNGPSPVGPAFVATNLSCPYVATPTTNAAATSQTAATSQSATNSAATAAVSAGATQGASTTAVSGGVASTTAVTGGAASTTATVVVGATTAVNSTTAKVTGSASTVAASAFVMFIGLVAAML